MSPTEEIAPLVLGAGGAVGSAVARALEAAFPGTIAATRAEADIADRFRLEAELERLRPTVVINCASYSDLDGCETDPERAWKTNAEGAENAARAAAAAGCRIVHVSTDLVFDGKAGRPYLESDTTVPLGELGRTRLAGEKLVAAASPDHLILRTSWVYGRGCGSYVDQFLSRITGGERVRAVGDLFGSPTWTADLAEALTRLLPLGARGIVHYCNTGCASRFEVATAIAGMIGAREARLESITAREAGGLAARPDRTPLDTSYYARLTGLAPRPWQAALRACLLEETQDRTGTG